jgi:hypothetical protein
MPPPPSVAFIDICSLPGATTGVLANVDDFGGAPIAMPFAFGFYDGTYTQVIPHADGILGFGTDTSSFSTYGTWMLPSSAAPHPAIIAYGHDLFQRATGECFATLGTAPNRRFAWEENDAFVYDDATTHLTWDVFLNEGTNIIDVVYQTMTGSAAYPADGSNAVVGMQNATFTRSTTVEYQQVGSIVPGLRLRFVPSS